ncbi:MAG: SpoIIE family protein phosphatase [Epsilonproteobacteria bacterium]|nr:SpoIIE family protein phosphatase [Campylobacterota bacterium]
MEKSTLKIGIYTSKNVDNMQKVLKSLGYEDIIVFDEIKGDEDFDIVFVDEDKFKVGEFKDSLIVVLSNNMDDEKIDDYLQHGVKDILLTSQIDTKLSILMQTLAKIKELEDKLLDSMKRMEKILKYKEDYDDGALIKQLNVIKDETTLKALNDVIYSSYFHPKEVASGDTYFTKVIGDKTFMAIVDAMGEGISPTITAIISARILECLFRNNEYSFKRFINKFMEEIKTVLLSDEALRVVFVEYSKEKIKYASFGMPPIYLKKESKIKSIKANNLPVTRHTKNYKTGEVKNTYRGIYLLSDGVLKVGDEGVAINFAELLKNNLFLNDILKDAKKVLRKYSGDVTILSAVKDDFEWKKVFSKEYIYNAKTVDIALNEVYELDIDKKDLINLILIELLLNFYEHQDNKINKDLMIKQDKNFEKPPVYAKITVYENDSYVKVVIKSKNKNKFDVSKFIKAERLKKYSGRGIITINFYVSALAYSKYGNEVRFYIRRENGI